MSSDEIVQLRTEIDNIKKETKKWMEVIEKWRVLSEMWKEDAKRSRDSIAKWKVDIDTWKNGIEEKLRCVGGDTTAPAPAAVHDKICVVVPETTAVTTKNTIGILSAIYCQIYRSLFYPLKMFFRRRF